MYIRNEKFNQPVFGCNNLSGEVWSTEEGGGPNGVHPPHAFSLYFKNGGVGTFLPRFYLALEHARRGPPPAGRHTAAQPPFQTAANTA